MEIAVLVCSTNEEAWLRKSPIWSVFVNQGISISQGAKTWHSGRDFLIDSLKPLAECEVHELCCGELHLELALLEALLSSDSLLAT